ncbi:Prophage CP4-57 regulatory protein (AlpA) (plasmid) [Halomonas sp. THAF12]|uniref:helix-turn-helix transcriptional regulator n=1 Tax=Halomonas sp. THAF12 TaxID=2587849 RepID=UPI0012679F93|nr:AlpA family phage regulatory protein [Halomonas sp. THAF12]QFT86808.1 Prophage CP4-57 regulatory protein (AlpA) [Halomonas sp. THAF12]QFT87051.1 Prophage CP4-57 regulatory protein (AlpA) [Halomonas sp. THAF12]
MKTTIIFDSSLIADPEQRASVEESPGFELANLLRTLADECDRKAGLPMSRALRLDSGPIVGEVATEQAWGDQDELVFLTTQDVIAKTGLPSTTLQRRRENDPTFPKPVVLSRAAGRARMIRWVEAEVEAWMRQQAMCRLEAAEDIEA